MRKDTAGYPEEGLPTVRWYGLHSYDQRRAGYYDNEPITLSFPGLLYTATCPRCLRGITGPASGITIRTEGEGDAAVSRILDNHTCIPLALPSGNPQ